MYEHLRNDVMTELGGMDDAIIKAVLMALDRAAARYEVKQKETAIAVYTDDIPGMVKVYLVCKKMAGCSEGTLENYQIILTAFFRAVGKLPEQIAANDIRMWLYLYQAEHGISLRTLDKYREYIARFFSWAHSEGYIPANPAKNVEAIRYEEKPREALNQVELENLRMACESPRELAIIETLYSTGCRVSELAGLKKADVNWREKTVQLFGKGRKHRVSFLNAKAEVALRAYLDSRTDQSEALFVSSRRPFGGLGKDAIEKIVRTLAQRASGNIGKHITPHVLRHTTATNALRSGMPIEDISRLLGHENIETTMIYAHASLESVREGHKKHIV